MGKVELECICDEINSRHCQYHQELADLQKENTELEQKLAVAVEALQTIKANGRAACIQLKELGDTLPTNSACFVISTLELFADKALAKLKGGTDET